MYSIFSFPNHPQSVLPVGLSLFLFGIPLVLTLVAIFSSPAFYHIPKPITSQTRRWEKSSITVSVGGYLGEWHVHSWKNDPTSNSGMNQRGIANTTHSKAIKQVRGGVLYICVCVCLTRSERKVVRKILTKVEICRILTEHNLLPGFMNECGHCSESKMKQPWITSQFHSMSGQPRSSCASYVIDMLLSAAEVCIGDLHRLGCTLQKGWGPPVK